MSLEELKKQFVVDEDATRSRLEGLVREIMKHCVVDKRGVVHITNQKLTVKDKLRVALCARWIGAQLESSISPTISIDELALATGISRDQVRARCSELIKEKFATAPQQGIFQVIAYKAQPFLLALS